MTLAPPPDLRRPQASEPTTPASPAGPIPPRKPGSPASEAPRGCRRRVFRALSVAALATAVAGGAILEGSLVTAPKVEALPAAVIAFDTAHASAPVMVAPADRISAAIVAVEDDSFYANDGVDVPALVRGLWGFMTGSDSGGSTIEIQLAHLAFPEQTTGLWGRAHRVSLALQMDTHFTKAAILSMYVNAAYFGHGFYGVRAASLGYFGVTPLGLSWDQAALLAGLVRAPSQLDPYRHPQAALQRRGYVLQRLVSTGVLTQAQADTLGIAPLELS